MVKLWGTGVLIAIGFAAAMAQSVNVKGTVTDSKGTPVAGAQVTLVGKEMSATTGSDGTFTITDATAAAGRVSEIPVYEAMSISRGVLTLRLTRSAPVLIELYDVKGTLIERETRKTGSAGVYRFDLLRNGNAAQVMVVRVTIGTSSTTCRYVPMQAGRNVLSRLNTGVMTIEELQAKTEAKIDSVKVAANGFITKVETVESYQTDLKITLDTLTRFSFFVTSLKSLQQLSGNEDGFGGDLSFGFTGQGAGLKGADSICECLAEMSMPGSKVKQWRAFLSVSKDENGKQVNARDRIGEGPWYDRMARLLSPTLTDLINERPQGGDPTIRDDLPNEWGVPNHTPEGTTVDNHHMITGSTTSGTLQEGQTCNDWTSTSASDQARCGFSWPRGMRKVKQGGFSGTHWISGFNSSGCKVGIWISSSGGGESGIIGSGGGYGGFYCFALQP